jgi:hypothetical protein
MMGEVLKRLRGLIADWLVRVKRAWIWIVLQFVGVALLIALGLLWTRIPDRHFWQVGLTLLVPMLVAAGFVGLQAGTFRGFLHPTPSGGTRRVALAWGAGTLVIWIAIGWVLWSLLDRFDDSIWSWAEYFSSKAGPYAREHWASFEHLSRDLHWAGWMLRWVIVPGLLMPLACSAAWGLRRLPWRRVLRLYIDWRWFPAVLACALIGEAWPSTWFEAEPHGSVHEQVTRVVWKLVAAYLLAMVCWVRLLGWAAMLLDDAPRASDSHDGGEPVPQPAIVSPPGEKHAAVPLPLPDTGEGAGGNA